MTCSIIIDAEQATALIVLFMRVEEVGPGEESAFRVSNAIIQRTYMAAFLCSDKAEFLIGQTITLDGGTTALMSLINDFRNTSTARFGTGYMPSE